MFPLQKWLKMIWPNSMHQLLFKEISLKNKSYLFHLQGDCTWEMVG